MKRLILMAACMTAAAVGQAGAQAVATASAPLRITAFGGVTGDYTGLELGKDLGITAGVDVEFRPFFTLYPALEVRGTYPVGGTLDRQRNVLGGLRLARQYKRLHPYGDVLFGQGQIDYGNGGYPSLDGNFRYVTTTSNVYSLGGGVDYALTERFGAKADFQLQRYKTPVVESDAIYSKAFTLALVYRFGFGGRVR